MKKIKSILINMPEENLVQIWNTFCEDTHRLDGYVFYNTPEVINGLFKNAWDAMQCVEKYDRQDKYFRLNFYGDIESFPTLSDDYSPVYLRILLKWIVDEKKQKILEY